MPLRATNSRSSASYSASNVGPVVVLDEGVERRLHRRHARVAALVDAVAEAHDLALLGERLVEPRSSTFDGVADLVEDVQDGLVRAAVQRALERADRADDGGVQVAERRGDDARGERRGVERVLRVEDHRAVERVDDDVVRLFAERHPEEVRGVVEVVARLRRARARGGGAGRTRRSRGAPRTGGCCVRGSPRGCRSRRAPSRCPRGPSRR